MRFQILGPLRIADGPEVVVLPPSKPTVLLAALLLRPGTVVSVGFLRRAIWGDEEPSSAKAALHACVLRLRKTFAKYGLSDAVIESVPGGYRIAVEPGSLDLVHFRELRARAQAERDPEAELCLLKEALSLWQGPLLTNVPSDLLRRDEMPRLVEERLRTVERACDIELALGRCGQALVELWAVARAHPGHERFREQLIEALYRTGRQADALAEYREVKRYLQDELGVDPGPALRRLELSILRGDDIGPRREAGGTDPVPAPAAPVPAPTDTDTAAAPPPGPSPLAAVSGFTGRAADAAALAGRLTADRSGPTIVVLSGAPGIGKTALALHTARQVEHAFPDGLAAVRMTRDDGTPRTPAEVAAELRQRAGARPPGPRGLLVLDDVTGADQVRPLLPAEAGGAVLVTSRLGLAGLLAAHGGWAHRLGTLAEEESFRLLAAVLGDGRAEAEPEAVRLLAAACGHFPFALRIMAARLLTRPRLSVAGCVAWLREDPVARLSLPDDPRLSVPRTFTDALDRLDPRLADAFLRVGSAPPERLSVTGAAGLLGVVPSLAEELLERLVDVSLLEEGPAGRYHMHELLRNFARRATGYQAGPPALTTRH
ncbi:AfsR/SARP family transcriptional regulator [Streptomyces albireticuli]|uniref:AfsR/SARP family transcriptional regulator n=1 Tax=Streptomyces albireticuli TaxID=1940 RepID=UPI000B4464C3|nr:AfsR/SARP family transcriptional regulator [Streptomyces albireticuli]